ncbi:MAG TPA: LysR family transcriptional regulator [Advenella sp.]|nr:LysR family transcriptional regulator [Advenella sp.]
MNFKQLNHIVVLSETLNFSKAAERVFLSQSALSKSIQAIEQQIGITIFDRSKNSVLVTPAGRFVIDHARHLLAEIRNFRKNLDYLKTGEQGTIKVGSGPFPAKCFLHTAIRRLQTHYPRVSLDIRIDNWTNLLVQLKEGAIDYFIADIRNLEDDPFLKVTPIGGLTVALFCDAGHPLIRADRSRPISSREILKYTFASVSLPTLVFSELKHSLGLDHNDLFSVNFKCDDISLINRLVPGSDIIFVSSNLMMEQALQDAHAVRLNIPMTRNRFGEWALVQIKDQKLVPCAEIFARMLIDIVREGSLQDDDKYGLTGNGPLNFIASDAHRT